MLIIIKLAINVINVICDIISNFNLWIAFQIRQIKSIRNL